MLIAGVWLLVVFSLVFATVLWALLESRSELERGWSVYGPRYGSYPVSLPPPQLPEAKSRASPYLNEYNYYTGYNASPSQSRAPRRRRVHESRDRRDVRLRRVDRQEPYQRALQAFSGP